MVGRQVKRAAVDASIWLCLLLQAALVRGEEDEEASEPRTVSVLGRRDPRLSRAVTLAVREASRRLDSAGCRQLLSDFTDSSGVALAAKLPTSDPNGRVFLARLIFRNGSGESYCERSGATLAAAPGKRFVFVCGAGFARIQASDPGYAAALVIHEGLHVWGLGEGPPSSEEITARVFKRCGR